jgi:hypothetical protein
MSPAANRRKAVTVRVSERLLRKLMRTRKCKTQSELINLLLSEAAEHERSWRAVRATIGKARPGDFDDRLL